MTRSTDARARQGMAHADYVERLRDENALLLAALRACVDAPQGSPSLTNARDAARELLARIDGHPTDARR